MPSLTRYVQNRVSWDASSLEVLRECLNQGEKQPEKLGHRAVGGPLDGASRIPREVLLFDECLGERPQLFQSPSRLTIPGRTPGTPPTVHALFAGERSGEQGFTHIPRAHATQTLAGENALANLSRLC